MAFLLSIDPAQLHEITEIQLCSPVDARHWLSAAFGQFTSLAAMTEFLFLSLHGSGTVTIAIGSFQIGWELVDWSSARLVHPTASH